MIIGNLVYLIVAILMFVSCVVYFGSEEQAEGWKKRFHSIMQIVFLIENILFLILENENAYTQNFMIIQTNTEAKIPVVFLLCGIPILIYTLKAIFYILKKEMWKFIHLIWLLYVGLFVIIITVSPCINTEKVLQEQANIVSYNEKEVRSTFLSDSIEGTDYVIKKQDGNEVTTEQIIETRTWRDYIKVNLHLHQESSYIEKYETIETYLNFFGNTFEQKKDEETYEIYLSDEMFKEN